ncbi:MAG: hypothetical protein N2508_07945 [Anaerolineae bacterium]|nr:hypothetical protein [Anaerolineae bacterium]
MLVSDAVPFNADEAVVALMARHILQGERPWFFYGQAYMGSLDAYLIAAAFHFLGERVLTIRLVQLALFLLTLATSYRVALCFTSGRLAGALTVLLMAFPPVLLTLYTTATLGGYGETLLVGNLLLWWGHRLAHQGGRPVGLWLLWGLVAGLGFWAFSLVVVYIIPVGAWLLWRLRRQALRGYLLSALAFAVGSIPWWLGNIGRLETGIAEMMGTAVRSTAVADTFLGNVGLRLFNFFVFGLTVLFGLRFPWGMEGPPLWLGVLPLALYLGALLYGLRRSFVLTGIWCTLLLGFILTPFGGDPSGRYFLPLYMPLFICTAALIAKLREHLGRWAWALPGVVLLFNLVGTARAALHNPPGITTQFEAITRIDHRYDHALIEFLRQHNERYGYTNYWVAYPIAFLSGEEIILVPRLPYKEDLRYTPRDDRYAPYGALVAASPSAVYVTTNHPVLNELLRSRLREAGVEFMETQIGDYHIFYALSRHVTPAELSLPPGG